MRGLLVFAALLATAALSRAAIDVKVCDPTDLRLLGIEEVMLGTQVSLVVYSDANDLWSGGLFIHDAHRGTGVLAARDSADPNDPVGAASCLTAAGERAFVMPWNDSQMSGFDLYTDEFGRQAGHWFVLDYTPLAEGDCVLHFYNHSQSFTEADPNLQVALYNSPTRDWDDSGVVDLGDWVIFAAMWLRQDCAAPDWCGGTDLDKDGAVGLVDLLMFTDFWLWGTPLWQRTPADPEPPAEPEEPRVFYAILDPNGLSEISIPIGQSIRLYLDKTTLDETVYVFSLEVVLSDPNLGWIDNTEYDPNDLYGSGTAELLATPRTAYFDYWGPGYTQDEGIQFVAASFDGPMDDGWIASFVYTPTTVGTATLDLVDYLESATTRLYPIVLHQYDPDELLMLSGTEGGGATMTLDGSQDSEPLSAENVEEMAQFLEALWEDEPQIQETFDEDEWFEFVDAVRTSAEYETYETLQ